MLLKLLISLSKKLPINHAFTGDIDKFVPNLIQEAAMHPYGDIRGYDRHINVFDTQGERQSSLR